MTGRDLPLETVPPLTVEGYAKAFTRFMSQSNQYDIRAGIARDFILKNNFDKEPVHMFSIGAGTGIFEKIMVQEQGLKLEYIYAIEPNPDMVPILETELKSLGAEYDIDTSFFSKEFEFDEKYGGPLFDVILLSHALYPVEDPLEAVSHAVKFLKPHGKILIFHQGEAVNKELYTYLINRSDPKIFSSSLNSNGDHTLTAQKITSYIRDKHPELIISVLDYHTYLNVNAFVRGEGESGIDDDTDMVSFLLRAEYQCLSKEARGDVFEIVKRNCDVVDGKYLLRMLCARVVVSLSS